MITRKSTRSAKHTDAARRLALRAGELHRAGVQRMLTTFAKGKGNAFRAIRLGIRQLLAQSLIAESEAKQLLTMLRILYSERKATRIHDGFLVVYTELKANPRTNPVALALAGIAVDSIDSVKDEPVSLARKVSVVTADAAGGAVGAGAAASAGHDAEDVVLAGIAGAAGSSGWQFIANKK